MMSDAMILIGATMAVWLVMLGLVLVFAWKLITMFKMNQTQLLNRIMARTLTEFASTNTATLATPEDALNQMVVENDLAVRAGELEQARELRDMPRGVPI